MKKVLPRLLFRIEGGLKVEYGTGHIRRSLQVAHALKGKADIFFCSSKDPITSKMMRGQGFRFYSLNESLKDDLKQVIFRVKPDLVVFDKLDNFRHELAFAKTYARVVTFDDGSQGAKKYSDCKIDGIYPQPDSELGGFKYLVLPKPTKPAPAKKLRQIFVSFGGFDAKQLVLKVLPCLLEGIDGWQVVCFCGHEYRGHKELIRLQKKYPTTLKLFIEGTNFEHELRQSELAVISGGLTLFQALQYGVASLVISQYPHQQWNAKRLEKLGAAKFLFDGARFTKKKLIHEVNHFLNSSEMRKKMGSVGKKTIDGKGIDRVSKALIKIMNEKKVAR